jgi:hypothetical protein
MGSTDSEGPAWNKFWMSLDAETESVMSGDDRSTSRLPPPMTPDARSHLMSPDPSSTRHPQLDRGDSVLPNDSASHHGIESPEHSAAGAASTSPKPESQPFPFKFRAPSGRMHRIQLAPNSGITGLVALVLEKLGTEADSIGGAPEVNSEEGKIVGKSGFAMAYLDNEGDTVSITTDADLLEAIVLASRAGREKVDLFVHDAEKPAIPATVDPHPGLPAKDGLRTRKKANVGTSVSEEEGYEDEEAQSRKQRSVVTGGFGGLQQEQMVPGVPNDLLLPGAIVTLAVVIVAVFTISRTTQR